MTAGLGLVVENIEVAGPRDDRLADDHGGAGRRPRHADPRRSARPAPKQQLETLPWVRSAAIERRLPDTLFVRLVERQPLAVWQHERKQELIDRDGEVIPVKDLEPLRQAADRGRRRRRQDRDRAARHAGAANRNSRRGSRAAVRVDGRRWNLRIDDAIDVLLPEEEPADAWTQLAALERTDNVLKRDVQTVDLRLPDRLVLRVATPAPPAQDAAPKKPHPPGKST